MIAKLPSRTLTMTIVVPKMVAIWSLFDPSENGVINCRNKCDNERFHKICYNT